MELTGAIIGFAVSGLLVGVCSGLLGIGGGTVMIPLLRLAFGLDAYAATATSLFTIVPTSLSGVVAHIRNKTCYPKLGIALGLGGAVTSTLGVQLGSMSPSWMIMLVAAVIIFYSAFTMLRKAIGRTVKAGKSAQAAPTAGFEVTPKVLAIGFGIGMFAGLCAGYVGVGGGFIMVPLMTAWLGVPMKKASGTSLVAIIILSIPGVALQMVYGHVDYLAGIMLSLGSVPGAAIGAKLVAHVNERQLRFLFAGFLLLAGILLVVNETGVL